MASVEATVAVCKCKKHKKTYAVRFENISRGLWKYDWAFPIDGSRAHREGYDKTEIRGNIVLDDSYPGCPYCGTKNFIICQCGKLNCDSGFSGRYTCEWCGLTGNLSVWEGGTISANGDV